jgi:hypothetical protein
MENQMISRKFEKELTKLFSTDGEVLIKMCDSKTNEPIFQVSQHIIKDKKLKTYGLPLYGLFGCKNGKSRLFNVSLTKELIINEISNYIPIENKK